MSAIIYRITNQVNGKFYIGQTIQGLVKRWSEHCYVASRESQCYIHRAIRKYGPDAFDVEVLEETTADQLNDREQYWITKLQPTYNMTEGGEGGRGRTCSPETRAKLRGLKHSPETRAKMRGRKHSPETRAKIRAAKLGRKHSPETRAKIGAAGLGRKHSPETRAKISAAKKRHANNL